MMFSTTTLEGSFELQWIQRLPARLPPVLQTLVLEEELAVYSPWVTQDCTTLNEYLECEPSLICIKPALSNQARVQLHHFNDDKCEVCKGTILSHGPPVEEEELHNTDAVLLLPADNDPASQIYRVELIAAT